MISRGMLYIGDVESWSGLLGEEWLDITAAIKLYKQLLVLQVSEQCLWITCTLEYIPPTILCG